MVKTRAGSRAQINRAKTKEMIQIFGHTLIHRKLTRDLDTDGQPEGAATTSDTNFTGDIQQGPDLDQRYLKIGIVEIGDAVLYMAHDALSTLPNPGDQIVDSEDIWEIVKRIAKPSLEGAVTHYEFRCKKRINALDT